MKPSTQAVFCSCFIALTSYLASAEPWKINVNSNVATTMNLYSDSWTSGEAGSFTWVAQFLGVAEKQLIPQLNSKTSLKLQFGQTKIQDRESKGWGSPKKSSDLIDFEELLRLTLGGWVDPFVSARVVSLFLDESDTTLTRYINPLDITEAAGISRTIINNGNIEWASRIGAAARQVVERNALDTTDNTRFTDITNDGGVEFSMDFQANNTQNWASLHSSLTIYEALVSSKAEKTKGTPEENDWRYPHIKWENTVAITFAKYLMLNLSVFSYYDKEISDNLRIKQTMSAGVTYIYSNSR